MAIAIYRKMNARNILLEEGGSTQTVGVRRRTGDYGYVRWGGFVDRELAKAVAGARPAKLAAARVGYGPDLGIEWYDVAPGKHLLGCLYRDRAYCVLDEGKPVVL